MLGHRAKTEGGNVMDAILISAKRNLIDVDDARKHLSDHGELYWSVGFRIDKGKFSFPIFGFIHVTGRQVEYRAQVTDIILFSPGHYDNPSVKPEPWRELYKNNPPKKGHLKHELVMTEIVPFSFDTLRFERYKGGLVRHPPEGYTRVRSPSQLPGSSTTPPARISIAERNLEEFVVQRLDAIEAGLSLVGRQMPTKAGRLDLLCRDSRGGYVVVELKNTRGADEVVGQISRYMGAIIEKYPNKKVRGIIIVGKKDDALRYAVMASPHIEVKEFDVSIR
jgi:hypothetical protein